VIVHARAARWNEAEPVPPLDTPQGVAIDAGLDPVRARALVPMLTRGEATTDAHAREALRANPDQRDQVRRAAFGSSDRAWGTPSSAAADGDEQPAD
jgi:hypothetical protein